MSCVVLSGAVVGNVEKHGCRCTRKRNVPFSCVTAPSTCLSGEPSVHIYYYHYYQGISYSKYVHTAHIFSYIWWNNVLYCTGCMVIHTVHTLPRGTQVLPVLTLAFPFLSRYRQGPRGGSRSLVLSTMYSIPVPSLPRYYSWLVVRDGARRYDTVGSRGWCEARGNEYAV